jgi:hypothetical protein
MAFITTKIMPVGKQFSQTLTLSKRTNNLTNKQGKLFSVQVNKSAKRRKYPRRHCKSPPCRRVVREKRRMTWDDFPLERSLQVNVLRTIWLGEASPFLLICIP